MTLDEVRADAFRRLSRGVADRRSPFRSPALATVGLDGHPQVRTVVLRAFDPAARVIVVHSDLRAGKVADLRANPAVALHVWDEGANIQVRAAGHATTLAGDAAQPEWDRLHEGSRATYTVGPMPGSPVADPASPDTGRLTDPEAFANFAVIRVRIAGLDWLHLARDGHRRARFTWAHAEWQQEWVVP
ncbi:MAG: pyridoxamine 5'-phosphate oxidase family protein [Gemmatimonadaceae bacterium]|nr:pyridoxamine 5'-phosphate oxidase family protein [Acetobacteraceae bacterium]